MSKFYVTTAIDYIDDVLHIGHAYQKVIADVVARYHRLLGDEVFFLTGVDEHGGKAEKSARAHGFSFEEWADKISKEDKKQLRALDISFDRYIRTTDEDHVATVLEFWEKIDEAGDLYLGEYEGIYCGGCERFVTEKDLLDGQCPYHPTQAVERLTEENYFFRLSQYEDFLKEYISANKKFVQPASRRKEILAFLERGLEDIPVSRPSVEWGIPVPGDKDHTIYVWFDALINYVSGASEGYWPADVHFLGKDNLFWHAILWPAMLESAGYALPEKIYGHGFLSLEGQKISKSIGNVVRPKELVEEFGSDAVRFYLCRAMNLDEDGNLSIKHLKEVYNADLANGLGNLTSRVATLCEKSSLQIKTVELSLGDVLTGEQQEALENFEFNRYLAMVWKDVAAADKFIAEHKPWEYLGDAERQEDLRELLEKLVEDIYRVAVLVEPFIPEASAQIKEQFAGPQIEAAEPLFSRID